MRAGKEVDLGELAAILSAELVVLWEANASMCVYMDLWWCSEMTEGATHISMPS